MQPVQRFFLFLKGAAMGAADVVPGVSGGTIAFISGIYEELLSSIASFNLEALRILRKSGLKAAWKHINGSFLLTLFAGIIISVLSLAKLISNGLKEEPVIIWSFFFGLVAASIPFMGKQVKSWGTGQIIATFLGAIIALGVSVMPATTSPESGWFLFIAGSIAICAMILPGISGSFILLLLGAYPTVIGAIDERNIPLLIFFALGCISGLLAFSKLLKWLFENYRSVMLSVLTGFLIGSLYKIWPWKEATKTITVHDKIQVIEERNIAPVTNDLNMAIPMAIAGFLVIVILEWVAKRNKTV